MGYDHPGPAAGDPRRLAAQYMPPGELRDEYLAYLDDLERKQDAPSPSPSSPPRPERAAEPSAGDDAPAWTAGRFVLAAAASVALAYGTWVLTGLL